jgi:hypothetical protein
LSRKGLKYYFNPHSHPKLPKHIQYFIDKNETAVIVALPIDFESLSFNFASPPHKMGIFVLPTS